jgi:hypothetical protein
VARFSHYLQTGETNRINGPEPGTHEINASTTSRALASFWRTANNVLSSRGGSYGRDVRVKINIAGRSCVVHGRVSERRRSMRGTMRVTELRFRPMSTDNARRYYGGIKIPPRAIAVVGDHVRGADYSYAVYVPGTREHTRFRPRSGKRERYIS